MAKDLSSLPRTPTHTRNPVYIHAPKKMHYAKKKKKQAERDKGWPGGQIEQLETRRCEAQNTTNHFMLNHIEVHGHVLDGGLEWSEIAILLGALTFFRSSSFLLDESAFSSSPLFPTDSDNPACLFHNRQPTLYKSSTIATTSSSSRSLPTSLPISIRKPLHLRVLFPHRIASLPLPFSLHFSVSLHIHTGLFHSIWPTPPQIHAPWGTTVPAGTSTSSWS